MFTVYKDKNDNYRWVTRSSNAYMDRDSEIVSQKALENDVDNSDKTGDYGPLRVWHIMYDQATNKGLDVGDCDFRMMEGKTLVESGTFRNNRIAKALSDVADKFQVSIGFNHPQDEPKDGVFYHIKTFERSLVPAGKAANPFTSLQVLSAKERTKAMDREKKVAEFKSKLSDEGAVDEFLENIKTSEKELDSMGMTFKGFSWDKLSATARLELAIQEVEYLNTLKEADNTDETIPATETTISLNDTTLSITEPEDTSTKAVNKKMPKKVEVEIEEEDEDGDEEMEEDEETSMKADMEYMAKAMSPITTELKACMDKMGVELKGYIQEAMKKGNGRSEKEASDLQTALEVTDAHTQRITELEKTVKELQNTLEKANEALTATTKELNALTGSQPSVNQKVLEAQKSFLGMDSAVLNGNGRPTQSTTNITGTGVSEKEALDAAKPPLQGFIQDFVLAK